MAANSPNNPGKTLREALTASNVRRVRCMVCGREHRAEDETFLAIYGDIHKGIWSPIIGENYRPETVGTENQFVLKSVSIVCRGDTWQNSCMARLLFPKG